MAFALLKISVVISGLFGASGRRFLDALVAGERSWALRTPDPGDLIEAFH